MKNIAVSIVLATLACVSVAKPDLKPGDYATEGGWGSMNITSSAPGTKLHFSIETVGANGHQCSVEGDITDNAWKADSQCVIRFMSKSDRVSVLIDPEFDSACRSYCGMRASLPGDYFPVVPFCSNTEKARTEFSVHYKAGRYAEAKDTLLRLLKACERFMNWRIQAEIRNDIAITVYRLGDKQGCLSALLPIKRVFIDDAKETGVVFTPMDQDWGKSTLKISRHNWKKCGGKLPVYLLQRPG